MRLYNFSYLIHFQYCFCRKSSFTSSRKCYEMDVVLVSGTLEGKDAVRVRPEIKFKNSTINLS
jgi:hypothetical protein